MGLAAAMSLIGDDRSTTSTMRDVLSGLTAAPGRWFTEAEIMRRSLYDRDAVAAVLQALVAGRVLDFEPASSSYRYNQDTVLDLEVRRFLRHADGNERAVRTNVDRFRQRYGAG